MEKEKRKYLQINNAILLHDIKQIQKEPPQPKIKTMRRLSKKIKEEGLMEGNEDAIYAKLYRPQKDGFIWEPTELIEVLLKVLEVEKRHLIN